MMENITEMFPVFIFPKFSNMNTIETMERKQNSRVLQKGLLKLINLNCTVGHDSIIGDFVEMAPGVHISGNCTIGAYCNIGTNATILPKITMGENVIVGAGSVVTKDVPANCLVVGVPAVIKKEVPKLIR